MNYEPSLYSALIFTAASVTEHHEVLSTIHNSENSNQHRVKEQLKHLLNYASVAVARCIFTNLSSLSQSYTRLWETPTQ